MIKIGSMRKGWNQLFEQYLGTEYSLHQPNRKISETSNQIIHRHSNTIGIKEVKFDSSLITCTHKKINFGCPRTLCKIKSIKWTGENEGKYICNLGGWKPSYISYLLKRIKEKTCQFDYINYKTSIGPKIYTMLKDN